MLKKFLLVLLAFVSIGLSAQDLFNEKILLNRLRTLSADSMQGRRTGTPGNQMAADYIQSQFQKIGIQPIGKSFESTFKFKTKYDSITGRNIIGVIKGKTRTDQYIVVSAHYDHLGVRDGSIYNGTDDNASGTSALLSVAEYLKQNQPLHTVILVAFDAEEMGLQGAKAFVQNPPVEISKIILNINMDMLARSDNNILVACGTFYYPQLKPFIEKVKPEGNLKWRYSNDDPELYKGKDNWTNSSDHGPFHKAKIPFIYFGVDDHPDYHQSTDDFDKVDQANYISCVKMVLNSIVALDKGLK